MHKFAATALAFAASAAAADWHFLEWYTPSGEQFIQFSGELVVPNMPSSGTTYIWPGLEPDDNSGVYQNVLQNGGDPFLVPAGAAQVYPSLPWGNGFNSNVGSTVTFNNVMTDSTNWTSTVTEQGNANDYGQSVFPLSDKNFGNALLAIEQYDVGWTFGPVYWSNILIVSTGTDSSWCNESPWNYGGATNYTITGLNANVVDNTVECTMESVTFNGPIGDP